MDEEKVNGSEEANQELLLFVLEEHEVTTVKGDKIKAPPLTWGKEVKIVKLINSLLGILLKSGVFSGGASEEQLPEVLKVIFSDAPEAMTKAAATLLDKEEKWINDNLISEEILGLLIPFLQTKRDSLTLVVQKLLGNLQAQMQTMTPQ